MVWSFFYALKYFGADPHDYEWYLAAPMLIFYIVYILRLRDKIALSDRRAATAKSIIYWTFLGVSLFASYEAPIAAKDYWSLNLLYLVFTIFLADSYWDFKKITMKDIKK
jgi:hypothetical protein